MFLVSQNSLKGERTMIDGISPTIEYMWTDGLARLAVFRNTDIHAFPQTADDPPWVVTYRDTGAVSDVWWLPYIANDGRLWEAKLHCHNEGHYVRCWFEHRMYGSGDDNHEENFMFFLDWDRHPWQATLNDVNPPFPAQPTFTLRRM
jgi:hypothetical protein